MLQDKVSWISYFINFFFVLYFVVLFGERLQSLIRSGADPDTAFFGSAYNGYVHLLTILSLAASVGMLLWRNSAVFIGLFCRTGAVFGRIDEGFLCLTAGVILLSGMVHTPFTIAPVQFGAYGALILSMILKTITTQGDTIHPFLLWFSLIYLTVFSMAIPVMYPSQIKNAALFHVIEAVCAIVLVVAFTFLLRKVYLGQATDLFFVAPILLAAVGDGVILAMRWKEKVNSFVLIFIILACVLWCVGKVLSVRILRS